ncbi:MAG: hypothetical protein O7B99_08855, partial [Planctomycetota bacterium]|nr:hypothetical protein [Planctomycetota bacterium]
MGEAGTKMRGLAPPAAGAPAQRTRVEVPGSKSQAIRLLVAGALARGESSIEGLPEGEDVRAAVEACDALAAGAEVHEVHVGESGTLARLVTAIVALTSAAGIPRRVAGRGTLAGRTSRPLFEALAGAGVGLRWLGRRHGWPV